MQEMLYRPGELAKQIGVTVQTIRNWTDEGRIKAVLTEGGHRRYKQSDVDALIQFLGTRDLLREQFRGAVELIEQGLKQAMSIIDGDNNQQKGQ